MICDELRVGVVTGHIPVKDVSEHITEEAILNKLELMNESLKKDFWIQNQKLLYWVLIHMQEIMV